MHALPRMHFCINKKGINNDRLSKKQVVLKVRFYAYEQ